MPNGSEDKLAGFAALLRRSLGDLLAPKATDFVTMMAEDGVMAFPYAPDDGVRSLAGRAELSQYLRRLSEVLEVTSFSEPLVHRTTDPNVVILEFTAEGRGVKTGAYYEQSYISVITIRDGYIQHYRDYWNPLTALQATGGLEALAAGPQTEVTHDG